MYKIYLQATITLQCPLKILYPSQLTQLPSVVAFYYVISFVFVLSDVTGFLEKKDGIYF